MANPGPEHWTAAKRVLRYLNGTRDLGIIYNSGGEIMPKCFSDSDWGQNCDDRRSISGNIFLLSNGPITWQSKRQPTVALSSMEAEYMAVSLATQQIIWLRSFLNELDMPQTKPTILYVDNQGTIKYSNNGTNHGHLKHIDVKHHFICEKLISNEITLQYVGTNDNLADLFTKSLPKPKHQDLTMKLSMAMDLRGSVVNSND